jgi:hypothetical protein
MQFAGPSAAGRASLDSPSVTGELDAVPVPVAGSLPAVEDEQRTGEPKESITEADFMFLYNQGAASGPGGAGGEIGQGMACVFIRLLDAQGRTVLRVPHVPQAVDRPQSDEWLSIVRAQLPQYSPSLTRLDEGECRFRIAIDMWGRGGLSIDALSQKLTERMHQVPQNHSTLIRALSACSCSMPPCHRDR